MYPVSEAYKAAIAQETRNVRIAGTITLADDSVIEVTDAVIAQGSLYFTEQCVSGEDIEVGNVYASEMGLTLTAPTEIWTDFAYLSATQVLAEVLESPYSLNGARIAPQFGIDVGEGQYEYVPLGYYYVTEINRKTNSIGLKALDGMILFDVDLTDVLTSGTPHAIISSCCTKVGVTLAASQEDIESMANGTVELTLPAASKVSTCRDLMMWICQALGAFARMNRLGQLEIVPVTLGTSVKTVAKAGRFSTDVSDFAVKITKVTMRVGETDYAQGTDGMTMTLEENPLLSGKEASEINTILSNLLSQITQAEYTPYNVFFAGDPALQAGDWITLPDTGVISGGDVVSLITHSTWRYRGGHIIRAAGKGSLLRGVQPQQAKTVASVIAIARDAQEVAQAANQSTQLIKDAIEGYVLIRKAPNETNEILIMDNPDPEQAVKIWRWNMGGLGYSDNCTGLDNPLREYTVAMTMDGAINADFLKVGSILTNLITIRGNTNFYWAGDYLYIVNPADGNEQIRLSKEGIRFTKDGGQTWRTALTFDGLNIYGDSETGYAKYREDGVKVYNASGDLMGHLGWYETLGEQTANFTRDSIAYKQDGSQVSTNQPRYEYAPLPAPVWQDLFDTDQLSQYTSGGDSPATWAVSDGVLTGTGGTQATLIKNDLLLQDCEIVVNSDQADDGGIVARYQDNNNYYLLALRDDKVISVTDTTFAGGGVGLRNHSATAFRALDFTVYYVQQGVMSEEANANLVKTNAGADPLFNSSTGWAFFGSGASIADGVLTLQSPDGTTVSGCQCTLTNLAQNTKHSFLIRARYKDASGTADTLVLDLHASDYDNAEQELDISSSQLTTAFQNFKKDGFDSQSVPSSVDLRIFTFSTRPIEVEFVQLEQKAFATSIMDGSRAAEVLTAPTAGVFQKGNWTVKLRYTPQIPTNVNNFVKTLWECYIDANNFYLLGLGWGGAVIGLVKSNGNEYKIETGSALQQGNSYLISFSSNGSVLRLCCNGSQLGSDLSYVEPVGTLPATMRVGCAQSGWAGAKQANGIISDFAVMSKAQILSEHQAEYNSGLPLVVDEYTTYLMSCDGHLKPTVRRFGLWSKNGEVTLVAPPVEGGIRIYDDQGNLRTHMGQYAAGKYGLKVTNGEIYATSIKSGTPEATKQYIQIDPGGILRGVGLTGTVIEISTDGDQGSISLYDAGTERARILLNGASTRELWLWGKNGSGISLDSDTDESITMGPYGGVEDKRGNRFDAGSGTNTFYGGLTVASGTKNCAQKTENFGVRLLSVRESPEVRFIDEGKAQLVNGECVVELDPIFLECIEPNSDLTPWLIHITPYADVGLYVAEIGDSWFMVKERNVGTSNTVFVWLLSAVRKGYSGLRIPEVFDVEF
ncbi:MAG: hypothetical protein JRD89_04030 [Deltaproteobacteria bacterium]|nr:hypothetical protein [Deltaproteobacteria bacterium]